MSKLVHFIAEVTARLKGDKDGVIAARNAKVAESGINLAISVKKTEITRIDIKLDKAQEALKAAKYPSTEISGEEDYVRSIQKANDEVVSLQNEMSDAEDDLTLLEALLTEFEQDGVDRNGPEA